MKKIIAFALVVVSIVTYSACTGDNKPTEAVEPTNTITTPINIAFNIINSFPHDTSSYTQGLILYNNTLYEGTGLEQHSKLMQVDLKSGKPSQSISIDPTFFGEGITILNDTIYQLTWQNHKVLVYDAKTFRKIKEFTWEREGWGITHNGTDLIISTGESNIYFVDPATFKVKTIIGVTDNNGPVGNVNELEYVDGAIYANIYLTDFIIKIDPSNGHVIGKMDLTGILQQAGKSVAYENGFVLNGIAYDSLKKSFFITGKKWPLLFEMKLN